MSIPLYVKRLYREQKEIHDKYNNCNLISYYETINNKDINIYELEIFIKRTKIRIKLNRSYPFTPPNMYIGKHDYSNMLCIRFPELSSCLCCKSLTCNLNWKPTKRIINLLDEFIDNKKIVLSIIYKRFLRSICIKNNIPFELECEISKLL